jgi:hypothetical protein
MNQYIVGVLSFINKEEEEEEEEEPNDLELEQIITEFTRN